MQVDMERSDEAESATSRVYRHGPEDNRPIRFIGDLFTIKATSTHTGGAYSLTEMTVSPHAAGPTRHHHPDCEEAFYVMTGELGFEVDEVVIPARSGTFVVVPRGARHTYTNPGDEAARAWQRLSRAGFAVEAPR